MVLYAVVFTLRESERSGLVTGKRSLQISRISAEIWAVEVRRATLPLPLETNMNNTLSPPQTITIKGPQVLVYECM